MDANGGYCTPSGSQDNTFDSIESGIGLPAQVTQCGSGNTRVSFV
jgi:hypothetical protein